MCVSSFLLLTNLIYHFALTFFAEIDKRKLMSLKDNISFWLLLLPLFSSYLEKLLLRVSEMFVELPTNNYWCTQNAEK